MIKQPPWLDQPCVMGVLNVTPDSFYPSSRISSISHALDTASEMVHNGATIIDIGCESTRPGATPLTDEQECTRLVPILETLRSNIDVMISIDTSSPLVMKTALDLGADMINDIRAFKRDGALNVVATHQSRPYVCIMHMQGEPQTMQANPTYNDIISDIVNFLGKRIQTCLEAGMVPDQIIIDPGFGFGKTDAHNLSLIKHTNAFAQMGYPVLLGCSRKSTIGSVLNNAPVEARLHGSLMLHGMAVLNQARIIRTHDVKATHDIIQIINAVNDAQ